MTARSQRIRMTLAALALLLTPALLFAAGRRLTRPGGPLLERAIARLGLTPDQVAEIKDIARAHQQDVEAGIEAVATARRGLFEAIHAEAPDPTAIRAAAARVGAAEGDLAVARSAIAQEVRGVLTPEQQVELKAMLADAQAMLQGFFGRVEQRFADFLG